MASLPVGISGSQFLGSTPKESRGERIREPRRKVDLPEGFQTAEFLLEHGFVDMIVPRQELRSEIARLIDYCQK